MKYLFSILFILPLSFSKAQTKTTTFEGRTVNVFPYRLEDHDSYEPSYSFESYNSIFNHFHIPYVPDSLVDGEYLIYYGYYHGWDYYRSGKKRKKKVKQPDTLIVAAVFNVKNNVKEGQVRFFEYDEQKVPIATGFYKNDYRDSVWTTQNTRKRKRVSAEFKAGVIEGKVIYEDLRYNVRTVKNIKNGKEEFVVNSFQGGEEIYQGRKVTVSNYRVLYGEDDGKTRFFDTAIIQFGEIEYVKPGLSDGEYVLYYMPYFDIESDRSLKEMSKQKKESIAYNFTIKNGQYNGEYYEFDFGKNHIDSRNNKKASVAATYKNDKLNGEYQRKNSDNEMYCRSYYVDGKAHGKTTYYRQGKVESETNWVNGVKEGTQKFYEKGKLIKMTTYKGGTRYGRYYKRESKTCFTSGFYGKNGFDSIQEVNCKKQSMHVYTNSRTPFVNMDTTDLDWYIMPVLVDYRTTSAFSDYTKHQEFGNRGDLISTEYLYKGYRKIPYVLVNTNGDTTQIATRSNSGSQKYAARVLSRFYDEKNKLVSEAEYDYSMKNSEQYDSYYAGRLNSWTYYSQDTVVKKIIFKSPKTYWNGWLTKSDSSIILNRTTNKTTIKETYYVKNLGTYVVFNNKDTNSFTTTTENLTQHYLFTKGDSVLITSTYSYENSLQYIVARTISLLDSTKNEKIDVGYLLCPLNPATEEYQAIKLTGKSSDILSHKGKPYTGKVFVKETIAKQGVPYKYVESVYDRMDGIYVTLNVAQYHKKSKYSTHYRAPCYSFKFTYKDGLLHGKQTCTEADTVQVFELNFSNGISHGSQKYKKAYSRRSLLDFEILSIHYNMGILDGGYTITNNVEKLLMKTRYAKGKLEGDYLEYESSGHRIAQQGLVMQAHFKSDTLDGEFVVYQNGYEKEKMTFVNGEVMGGYESYRIEVVDQEYSDSVHDYLPYYKSTLSVKTKLQNGVIVDTVFIFSKVGGLKYIAVVDTNFKHQYFSQGYGESTTYIEKRVPPVIASSNYFRTQQLIFNLINRSDGSYNSTYNYPMISSLGLDPEMDNVTAEFTFFYKSGRVAQKGSMLNGSKHGVWKYWSEEGILRKEVDYTDDRYFDKGLVTTYYPNGGILIQGGILTESIVFDCDNELNVPYESVRFKAVYNENGLNIYNKGNCQVIEYYLDGTVRYTGQLVNGKYSRLWKYYDPTGNLNEIGEYVDGRKHGRWLKGDLGGINYLGNVCSINEALSLIKERQSRNIDIEEIIYVNGVVKSGSHLSLEKF